MTRHRRSFLKPPYGCVVLLVGALIWFPTGAFATDTPAQGALGGVNFRAECPVGSFLVGFSGRTGAWIDQLAPVCARLSADRSTLGASMVGQAHGTSRGGNPIPGRLCGTNSVIVVLLHWMTIGDSGEQKFVKGMNGECLTASGQEGVAAAFGTYDPAPLIDLTKERPTHRAQCPSSEFARGIHGRKGQFINALGLICGPLVPLQPGMAPPSQAKNAPSAFPNAPTIDLPNGLVIKGKGVFKITPSKYLTGSHVQIQLKWLNPPASLKGQDFYNYDVPIALIGGAGGMAAPDGYLGPGRWEMRVRINQPKVSDWSEPVQFEYYMQNPAAAPKTATPLSVEGQKKRSTMSSGTSIFRPQTTPSQGLGNTTVVLPRGVDEEDGNQTVDQSTGTERKP